MKYALALAALTAAVAVWPTSSLAVDNKTFKMVASSASCVPGASARVTVSTLGDNQTLHVEATGLPARVTFTLFVIQVPEAPFGLASYQGDIRTDSAGVGVGNFTGIFSIETFIVAPGKAPAPVVFPTDASSNPPNASGPAVSSRDVVRFTCRCCCRWMPPAQSLRSTASTMLASRC